MSLKTKKRFKNIGKVVASLLFALLLFTNIKVTLMDDAELLSGDISVLGIELALFEPTYACGWGQDYWFSIYSESCFRCTLPGSECSFQPLYCF